MAVVAPKAEAVARNSRRSSRPRPAFPASLRIAGCRGLPVMVSRITGLFLLHCGHARTRPQDSVKSLYGCQAYSFCRHSQWICCLSAKRTPVRGRARAIPAGCEGICGKGRRRRERASVLCTRDSTQFPEAGRGARWPPHPGAGTTRLRVPMPPPHPVAVLRPPFGGPQTRANGASWILSPLRGLPSRCRGE